MKPEPFDDTVFDMSLQRQHKKYLRGTDYRALARRLALELRQSQYDNPLLADPAVKALMGSESDHYQAMLERDAAAVRRVCGEE